jgi:hypothetical protein
MRICFIVFSRRMAFNNTEKCKFILKRHVVILIKYYLTILIGLNTTRSTPHEHQLHFHTITHLVQRENTTV